VGAAIHSYFSLPRKDETKRLTSAMSNPNVDILFHPTGRIIQQRQSIDVDIERILQVSKETNTILEIDASPDRLDLRDEYIKLAIENGCKLTIDSDAHDKSHMHFVKFGISQARRGWAEQNDVINTMSLEKFLKSLK
jgi:DNA polymerase (family X)